MQNNIPIALVGISHKTAPVEVRERASFSADEQVEALHTIKDIFRITGCQVLSTCNRTEIFITGEEYRDELPKIKEWLNAFKRVDYFTNDRLVYTYFGEEAVNHFFQVISGLDSMIVGEPQITGQVKDAYNRAHQEHTTDTLLNKLFNYGLQAEKKIRSETFLTDGAVSVSFAGVELARKIFTSLEGKKALLVGAGETAELAALHFLDKGVKQITIANRTAAKAEELAEKFAGEAVGLDRLGEVLEDADIVISATSSTEYVISRGIMEQVSRQRHHRPVFLIDLAIPRDIDPKIDRLDGVYLYNLDDLHEIVEMNLEKRKQEIPKSLKIVDEYLNAFKKWASTHSVSATISRLKEYFDSVRKGELERLHKRLPENGMDEIDYLTCSIMNKLMHQHIKLLKNNVGDPQSHQKNVEFVHKLYELDQD